MKRAYTIVSLVAAVAAFAGSAGAATSNYPIEDPLAATVVGTPSEMRADLPRSIPFEIRSLQPLVERSVPSVLNYALPLEYLLAAQDGPAPLAFVIAGTGAGAMGAKSTLLMRILYAEGYHVVALPSPTNVGFMLAAAQQPVPGRTSQDVAALYRMMRAVNDNLKDDIEITDYALTGYSLGGLHAAFVAHLDAEQRVFDFGPVLLVNPAVDLYQSVRRMDALLADNLPGGIAGLPRFLEHILGQVKRIYTTGDPIEFNEDFLYRAYRTTDTEPQQMAGMIGLAFRLWLANMSFAADLLTDSGKIVSPEHEPSPSDSLERYLLRSFSMSFADYMDELLLPYYNRGPRGLTREQLIHEGELQRIDDYLARAKNIGVVTNEDELILDQQELAFLRTTFGERATIFENGGHMGNLAHHEVTAVIRRFFRQ